MVKYTVFQGSKNHDFTPFPGVKNHVFTGGGTPRGCAYGSTGVYVVFGTVVTVGTPARVHTPLAPPWVPHRTTQRTQKPRGATIVYCGKMALLAP